MGWFFSNIGDQKFLKKLRQCGDESDLDDNVSVQAVRKAKSWIRMIRCERRKMESILSPICKMSLKCFFSL